VDSLRNRCCQAGNPSLAEHSSRASLPVSAARPPAHSKHAKPRSDSLFRSMPYNRRSGGRGNEPEILGWPEANEIARQICSQMASDSLDRYLVKMAKKDRVGRIFLDYLRNDRMATAVAPLSRRAREHAPVSMPIVWTQVTKGLDPKRYTLRSVPKLLAKSRAWQGYNEGERPLLQVLQKIVGK
jgi:DNA primase